MNRSTFLNVLALCLTLMHSASFASAARASGFTNAADDDVNVYALSCSKLWHIRNFIYHRSGFCFKTAAALREFGNAGCIYVSESAVPLSAYDRATIALIWQVERSKGCPN